MSQTWENNMRWHADQPAPTMTRVSIPPSEKALALKAACYAVPDCPFTYRADCDSVVGYVLDTLAGADQMHVMALLSSRREGSL